MTPLRLKSSLSILLGVVLAILSGSVIFSLCAAADDSNTAPEFDNGSNIQRDRRDEIPVTRWIDNEGRRPTAYSQWKASRGPAGDFVVEQINERQAIFKNDRIGLFCVLVNETLYPNIEASLDQYTSDVTADGFSVELFTISGGNPEDIRSFLQSKYSEGMVGAVLIGDLPVPWYEANCWSDPVEHEEFPCDLFYMDLDGTWDDIDFDGLFDDHYGDVTPEVWVGRLTASSLTYGGATEATLLQNYFYKNHMFRTGAIILENRGLAFVDDDWQPWASSWGGSMGSVYPDVNIISDEYETTAPNYEVQLPQNYEAILVCAHSSPYSHSFKTPSGNWTSTGYDEVVNIDPVAVFYNLFACSNSRYIEGNYMGGWYIFCQTYGLASIGSTKTGSMLDFQYFYNLFGNDQTIGQSFVGWFGAIGSDGYDDYEICWHYGMTLCGDPTLKRHPFYVPSITTEILPDGFYGDPYSVILEATGGIEPYIWQIIDGVLPKDLVLDTVSGEISGLLDEAGNFSVSVAMTDASEPPFGDTVVYEMVVNFVCGDANNDAAINVADAVFLINYIFKNGPAPALTPAGDANCDLETNVADCVYLINHVFNGGPEPCCP